MKTLSISKTIGAALLAATFSMSASSAHAQSTNEVLGAVLGGAAGAIIGGEIDNKGSKKEGRIIGGIVGAGLGYVIADQLSGNDRDRELRRRYSGQSGEYYKHDGRSYRRYRDAEYGFVSFPILGNDPYYHFDGRKKSHPVFAQHPGRGKGKGLKKRHKHYKF
jgi:uncharacterized protein YcfJ